MDRRKGKEPAGVSPHVINFRGSSIHGIGPSFFLSLGPIRTLSHMPRQAKALVLNTPYSVQLNTSTLATVYYRPNRITLPMHRGGGMV